MKQQEAEVLISMAGSIIHTKMWVGGLLQGSKRVIILEPRAWFCVIPNKKKVI